MHCGWQGKAVFSGSVTCGNVTCASHFTSHGHQKRAQQVCGADRAKDLRNQGHIALTEGRMGHRCILARHVGSRSDDTWPLEELRVTSTLLLCAGLGRSIEDNHYGFRKLLSQMGKMGSSLPELTMNSFCQNHDRASDRLQACMRDSKTPADD